MQTQTITALLLTLVTCVSSAAAAVSIPDELNEPVVGWDGNFQVGRWAQVIVPVSVDSSSAESTAYQLEIAAVDSDGNRVVSVSPPEHLQSGRRQLSGAFKSGRLNGEIEIRVLKKDSAKSSVVANWRATPGAARWIKTALKPSVRMIATVGEPNGFDFEDESSKSGTPVRIIGTKLADLPTDPRAYDSLLSLVIAGSLDVSQQQSEALRDWVVAGGRLVISLNHQLTDPADALGSFSRWVPVTIGAQPATVREFGGLETFSGKTARIPYSGILSIPSLKIEAGEVQAASRSDAFLVRVPYGMGSVSVLALDLKSAPLSEWKALSPFCARLAGLTTIEESADRTVTRGAQLSSTGITDLTTQIQATQDNFEAISRPTPWFVMGLLFALMIIVGPIDYLVVHHLIKKPHGTWITFPTWILLFTVIAFQASSSFNGTRPRTNQLDIINIDSVTGETRGRHLVNLYSPSTKQTTVTVRTLPLSKASTLETTASASWQGVPESNFGGMLRETGFEQGAEYQQLPDGQLTGLPLIQWNSKSVVAESRQVVEGIITSDLKASPTGRLTGTLTHRFADSIEDWMIVYKHVAYRHLKNKDDPMSISLPPNQVWRVDQPAVFSRDLRPFLTGIITMATPRPGMKASYDPTTITSNYDPLSLDPYSVIRTLTFHDHIGADRYTGLTNQLLDHEDLSHLLKLGRAVLFGKLKQPLSTVLEDSQAIVPDRQTSLVRLILPVTPSSTLMKELPRVVPE